MASDLVTSTGLGLQAALISLWNEFVRVIPGLIAAVIVLIVGWIVAKILKEVTIRLLQKTKMDHYLEDRGLSDSIGGVEVSVIIGSLVKWYVITLFLAQAIALIEMQVLRRFAEVLVFYVPLVLAAAVILILGLILARYVKNIILATGHQFRKTASVIAELIIVYVASVMALQTMGFNVTILLDAFRIAFAALAITVAIVLGISFALAFRKDTTRIVDDIRKDMKM
ncbi:MAG: hypothetical protein Q7S21_01595 [archaeon]|nr:hypothetical protein [archaeon]